MLCYICESERRPVAGLMRIVSAAAGVCHQCGIGVCMKHGHRASTPGAPFLCDTCAHRATPDDVHAPKNSRQTHPWSQGVRVAAYSLTATELTGARPDFTNPPAGHKG